MVIAALLLSFSLNIINHGDNLIGLLNTLLLFFSIYLYFKFSKQKASLRNFLKGGSPLIILIGAIPLFTRVNNILIIFFAIGVSLLTLLYLTTKFKKISLLFIVIYLFSAGFYANGLIKPPFSLQPYLLIINDDWANLYIAQMKTESMYMPYIIRSAVFNLSVYFYVVLSKMAGLFTLKNFYDSFLIANIYPLGKGLILDLKNWNGLKTLLVFFIFLISLAMVFSRSGEINNTFLLSSPILLYFVLRGLNSVNKTIYLILFVISLFVATAF